MSLAGDPESGSLTPVGESHYAEAGAVDSIYQAKWKASERKSPIALVEGFANVWQVA
jgi:hypothetical protein